MRQVDFRDIRRVLIRSVNWIGDAVMTTPAMGAVRAAFPAAEVVVAANPAVAELLSPHPYCDRVLVLDKKKAHGGMMGLLSFCRTLRRERFDLAILFQNAIEAAVMAWLAGIPARAGYRTDGRGFLLTHPVSLRENAHGLHHTDYYLQMLERLGIRGGDGHLRLECTKQETAWAREKLGSGEWVAINPGAAYGSAKRWFPERFAAVADHLHREHNFHIVLIGGKGEMEIGREIQRNMHALPLNLIGKTSVRRMMSVLSLCRLAVTNDSGPMHVAAAFGVPVAALFGPTDHSTTSPLMASSRIVRHEVGCAPCLLRHCPTDHRCMKAISVEDVLEAAADLLGKSQ